MKINYLLSALALCLCTQLTAQIQKGKVLIGSSTNFVGSLGTFTGGNSSNNAAIQFGKSKNKIKISSSGDSFESESNVTSFNLTPSLGYFISDQFVLGASCGIYHYKEKQDDDEFGYNIYSFAPMLRGYFLKTGKALPFAELRGGILSIALEDDSESILFYNAKAGASIFLGQQVSLDLFADLFGAKNEDESDSFKSTSKVALFGLGIGLNVFLSKKEKQTNKQ